MMVPVRCFTCGNVVGSAKAVFDEAVAQGKSGKEALDATGLERFCCRRMVIASRNLVKDAAPYE